MKKIALILALVSGSVYADPFAFHNAAPTVTGLGIAGGVIFNDNGALGGNAGLTFTSSTGVLYISATQVGGATVSTTSVRSMIKQTGTNTTDGLVIESTGGGGTMRFRFDSSANGIIGYGTSGNQFVLKSDTSIGIGTTATTASLTVVGVVSASAGLNVGSNGCRCAATGDIGNICNSTTRQTVARCESVGVMRLMTSSTAVVSASAL